jgi:hypothetical protein
MASRGVCCAAQAAGDLGKPLIVTVHFKNGTVGQRCGVCEIRPSCSNPQKLVFAFRFLTGLACGLATTKCAPTQAGIAQYNATATAAGTTGQQSFAESGTPPTFLPVSLGSPYQIPQS